MYIKKLIAPIIVTILLLSYYGFILLNLVRIPESMGIRILLLVIPLGFMGVSIYVLFERIKEIRSGDEDDLGKY
ncbi:hypothetical protein [Gudongella sp. DL1XJH-153]|uniref:hypothetical protein n=1 Tax=Gudongella sp. DL1XJH-153 TaxID=3409804 RepID=UPI003BB4E83D